ncbi:E3 ubiquitin protein ligase DRIP2-like isoform X1 [Typha latifolia]|uniref:E3 ubiquitin protein ligase DRIP2-like isoform X1 n=2 Tax=Typha latifolia TaxID=4733 RepID=UPI003C30A73B
MAGPSSPRTPPQVVRVRRELLFSRMTCPLCHKLLREATTISECLHTFCRKCIYEKLTDEEVDCCPICNIGLGCVPLEKLRPDHNMQDIRAKIFPFKSRKVNIPEAPSVPLPVRRKERSLSSLVVSAPRVATQTGFTGRRTKAARRAAASRGASSSMNEFIKEENNVKDRDEKTSSPMILTRMSHRKVQNNLDAETSNNASKEEADNGRESFLDKAELWKPLTCLVEAANRTKALRSSPQRLIIKEEKINNADNEPFFPKTKCKEHLHKYKAQEEKNGSASMPPASAKARKLNGTSRRKKDIGTSARALLDAASTLRHWRTCPIWFSLVASPNLETGGQLAQLPANYLRIKDGTLPVSSIQKYLAKRLDLASENEVEIMCQGQPMSPNMSLHSLVDLWLKTESSNKIEGFVGSSGKDFVTVLTYRRKISAP